MTSCPAGDEENAGSARAGRGSCPDGTAFWGADPDLAPAAPAPGRHRGGYRRRLARLADRAAEAGAELLALAAPVECICCGAEDLPLCASCTRRIRLLTLMPFRAEGQAPALMEMDGTVILPVVAAGVYRGELAQAVLSFKIHGQGQVADVLAMGLGRALAAAVTDRQDLCLVPVPTGRAAFLRRGFSPVHLLMARLRRLDPAGITVVDALRKSPRVALASGPGGPARRAEGTGPRGPGTARARLNADESRVPRSRHPGAALPPCRRRAHYRSDACRSRPCSWRRGRTRARRRRSRGNTPAGERSAAARNGS